MSKHTPEVWTEGKYRGEGTSCALCGKNIGKGFPVWLQVEQVNEFRGDDVVSHRHVHCHKKHSDMAANALAGISHAEPGSVKQLVEAARKLAAFATNGTSCRVCGAEMGSHYGNCEALSTKTALAAIRVEGEKR